MNGFLPVTHLTMDTHLGIDTMVANLMDQASQLKEWMETFQSTWNTLSSSILPHSTLLIPFPESKFKLSRPILDACKREFEKHFHIDIVSYSCEQKQWKLELGSFHNPHETSLEKWTTLFLEKSKQSYLDHLPNHLESERKKLHMIIQACNKDLTKQTVFLPSYITIDEVLLNMLETIFECTIECGRTRDYDDSYLYLTFHSETNNKPRKYIPMI